MNKRPKIIINLNYILCAIMFCVVLLIVYDKRIAKTIDDFVLFENKYPACWYLLRNATTYYENESDTYTIDNLFHTWIKKYEIPGGNIEYYNGCFTVNKEIVSDDVYVNLTGEKYIIPEGRYMVVYTSLSEDVDDLNLYVVEANNGITNVLTDISENESSFTVDNNNGLYSVFLNIPGEKKISNQSFYIGIIEEKKMDNGKYLKYIPQIEMNSLGDYTKYMDIRNENIDLTSISDKEMEVLIREMSIIQEQDYDRVCIDSCIGESIVIDSDGIHME